MKNNRSSVRLSEVNMEQEKDATKMERRTASSYLQKTLIESYRGIAVLDQTYKILATVIAQRSAIKEDSRRYNRRVSVWL